MTSEAPSVKSVRRASGRDFSHGSCASDNSTRPVASSHLNVQAGSTACSRINPRNALVVRTAVTDVRRSSLSLSPRRCSRNEPRNASQ